MVRLSGNSNPALSGDPCKPFWALTSCLKTYHLPIEGESFCTGVVSFDTEWSSDDEHIFVNV